MYIFSKYTQIQGYIQPTNATFRRFTGLQFEI